MQDAECKRLLKRFCGVLEGVGQRDIASQWSMEVLQQLITYCNEPSRSTMTDIIHLGSILHFIKSWCQDNGKPIPGPFKRLLCAISRDYPIIGLLRHGWVQESNGITPLMEAMEATLSADLGVSLLVLRSSFPLMFQLAKAMNWHSIPAPFVDLTRELVNRARHPLKANPTPRPQDSTDYDVHVAFSPSLPTIHTSPTYRADGVVQDTTRDEVPCTKHLMSHPGLTPGIFAVFCPHGLCMGFAIMSRSEGPKTFFEFICHRFSKAPKMIVYDNCCNLHRYCLRREPNFFSQTWFLIDRLHQRGHIACHEGYNMDVYPEDEVVVPRWAADGIVMPEITLGKFNSQAAEQCNAKLDQISTQVAYMSQANFMAVVKYYLFRFNKMIIEKLTV